MHSIHFVDSHTGGEPTRVVLSGFPNLDGNSIPERLRSFRQHYDRWRRSIVMEPRGSDTVVGALLLKPSDLRICSGVIFFNNVGYLGMCGHGSIGVVRTLHHLGRIEPGRHQFETPAGIIGTELLRDGRVTVDNVESYRLATNVRIDVPGYGGVCGDVAWGGNWFFITRDTPCALKLANRVQLTAYSGAIRAGLVRKGVTGAAGAVIDHIEINGPPDRDDVDGCNFVLCPGGAYDRSPCGTGTSAKLACLAAEGRLAPGQVWRQAGILGTMFEASYQPGTRGVLPRITGRAWITASGQLLLDDEDPLVWGIGA